MGGIISKDKALQDHLGLSNHQIKLISDSWQLIKAHGTEKTGAILFIRFFEVAPETFYMFSEFRGIEEWKISREFGHHCKIVMNIIGGAVGLLRDPESLDSTLEYLGLKHEGFAINESHFDLMGVELIATLREVLVDKLTSDVEAAWKAFYAYIAKIIIMGMNRMEVGVSHVMMGKTY